MIAYLHGFASGPGSTKAQVFRARLAELGLALEISDLAPDFTHLTIKRWTARLGPAALAEWRARGTTPVFHYGEQREVPLGIALLDDAARYPAEPDPTTPALVFAGRHDDAVPLAAVEHFARARPGRELVVLASGHELTDVLEPMWERTTVFLRALGVV